jgi:glycosyltransferase involved in cell wall biosynthesis
MSLRVGIVASALNVQHLRGTGRYIQELLRNTVDSDDIHWTAYGCDSTKPFRVPADFQGDSDVFGFRGDRFHLWEQIGLPLHVRQSGVQLLHCASNTVPIWKPVPTIVTIHDTVIWAEPSASKLGHHYLHDVQGFALRGCAAIVTISQSSRRDIISRWPALENRIEVIPHGIADEFFHSTSGTLPPALLQALGSAPYLLYLGGPQPRKRFAWALELLAQCGREDIHLVACGFGTGTAPAEQVPQAMQSRVHFAPFVQDCELVMLYQGALAALYPTLYEGFGFPAVEAQAAGTPIIFSPVSSLEDMVGPLTWPVAADDFSAWRAALQEILSLPAFARAELAIRGIEWARQFSWRRSVERHLAVYHDVLARESKE